MASGPGSFSRHKNLEELTVPDYVGGNVKSAATRQAEAVANLGITASIAEINGMVDQAAQAVTASADGTGTGAITEGSTVVIVTSAAATNQVALPGIAANSLPIGYTVKGRVGANGFEMITLAASNETINGTDADGTNQLDVAATSNFIAWVESATGWAVMQLVYTAPDND